MSTALARHVPIAQSVPLFFFLFPFGSLSARAFRSPAQGYTPALHRFEKALPFGCRLLAFSSLFQLLLFCFLAFFCTACYCSKRWASFLEEVLRREATTFCILAREISQARLLSTWRQGVKEIPEMAGQMAFSGMKMKGAFLEDVLPLCISQILFLWLSMMLWCVIVVTF